MRRNIYYTLTSQWASAAVSIGSTIIVSRLLGPKEIGVFIVAMALGGVLGNLQMAGASEYLIYTRDISLQTRQRVFGLTLIFTSVIAAGLVAGRPLLDLIYGPHGVSDVAAVIAAKMIIIALVMPVQIMLTREQRFGSMAIVNLAAGVVLSLGQIGFVYLGWGYMGLAYGDLLSGLVYAATLCMVARHHILWRPRFDQLGPMLAYSTKLFSAGFLTTVYMQIPSLLLGSLVGLRDAGLYGRANIIGQVYSQTVGKAIDPVLRANIASRKRSDQDIFPVVVSANKIMLPLSLAAFGFCALTAHLSVPLVFGAAWTPAGAVMSCLCVGLIVMPLATTTTAVVLANQRPDLLVRIRAINLLARIVGLVVLAPFGLLAVAVAIAISFYIDYFQSLVVTARLTDRRIRELLWPLRGSLLIGLGSLACSAASLFAAEAAGFGPWSSLMTSGLVLLAALGLAAKTFDHPMMAEVSTIRNRAVGWLQQRRA